MIENIELKYKVGALLYSPALNNKVADSIISERITRPYSLALCLEDTIADDSVEFAEKQLISTLRKLLDASRDKAFYMPLIFIRVRSCEQVLKLWKNMYDSSRLITGFIFAK